MNLRLLVSFEKEGVAPQMSVHPPTHIEKWLI